MFNRNNKLQAPICRFYNTEFVISFIRGCSHLKTVNIANNLNLIWVESTREMSVKHFNSWIHWLWLKNRICFEWMQLCHTVTSLSPAGKRCTFSHYPGTVLHHIKSQDKHLPSRSMCPPCGTVHPWLLVLLNALSTVTHKAFVFHHAAVSAHPLCQPASLLPGIIYPRSTEHMGHSLSSLSIFLSPWYHSLSQPIKSSSRLSGVM